MTGPLATAGSRPTRADLEHAAGQTIPDVLAPGLRVVFVGINPGLYSAAVGHHFARPGNRFWKALQGAGFTDRLVDPAQDAELIRFGLGVTNLVARATGSANELCSDELRAGVRVLERKIARLRPAFAAVLGLAAFRTAFGRRRVAEGPQQERLCDAELWLLPNPSGLNAHYQLPALVARFAALRDATERSGPAGFRRRASG